LIILNRNDDRALMIYAPALVNTDAYFLAIVETDAYKKEYQKIIG